MADARLAGGGRAVARRRPAGGAAGPTARCGWWDWPFGSRRSHWLRLPHWATCFGWLAMSFYFAFYLPVFVGLSRVAVHRLRVPVIVAAPVVWTGLELARAHLLTGMTMASLGHSQYRWVQLIQVSDLAGAFGVSFLVMFVAACLGRMAPCDGKRWAFWPMAPATAGWPPPWSTASSARPASTPNPAAGWPCPGSSTRR